MRLANTIKPNHHHGSIPHLDTTTTRHPHPSRIRNQVCRSSRETSPKTQRRCHRLEKPTGESSMSSGTRTAREDDQSSMELHSVPVATLPERTCKWPGTPRTSTVLDNCLLILLDCSNLSRTFLQEIATQSMSNVRYAFVMIVDM
uniref:Uncharacterized protein n=2 Tax=Helianthus annuus TaxID=4232 RepID=A0A251TTN8_HELAN